MRTVTLHELVVICPYDLLSCSPTDAPFSNSTDESTRPGAASRPCRLIFRPHLPVELIGIERRGPFSTSFPSTTTPGEVETDTKPRVGVAKAAGARRRNAAHTAVKDLLVAAALNNDAFRSKQRRVEE
jgi:hypothetical protein